jgi:acetyl/propionyl-CoA carboxylase alpha subunit
MLAKVIARGATRDDAAAELASCLEGLLVAGVPTNRGALAAILRSDAFLAGDTTTAFLAEHAEVMAPRLDPEELARHVVAAALGLAEQERVGQPWARLAPLGWRNVAAVGELRRFGYAEAGDERAIEVRYAWDRTGVAVTLAEPGGAADRPEPEGAVLSRSMRASRIRCEGNRISLDVDGLGSSYRVQRAGEWVLVSGLGRSTALRVLARYPETSAHAHDHGLVTPVPGTVTGVLVAPGDAVSAGEPVVILEAMKMEHRILADGDGIVAEVRVAVGDSVDAHHVVAVLEEAE